MRLSESRLAWLRKGGAVAVLCGIYLLFSCLHLKRPGLQYDEVLFANASLGNLDHSFVLYEWKIGCIHLPLMLMPYIGALKAYFYAPIFRFFSPSPIAVRLPVVIIGLITLIITYRLAYRILGERTAFIATAMLAFDPGYIFHIRLDWGPVAMMMLLKMGSLYCLVEFALTRRSAYLKLGALLLGLGLYDKVNFFWYLLALPLAAFVVWRKQCRELVTFQNLRLALAFFLLGCWPLLTFNLVTGGKTFKEPLIEQEGFSKVIRNKSSLLWSTLEGYTVYGYVNGHIPPPLGKSQIGKLSIQTDWIPMVLLRGSLLPWVVLGVLLIVGFLWGSVEPQRKQALTFILLLALLIQFQIYMTSRATGSHHIMMLYPFPHLFVAHVFALLSSSSLSWFARRAKLRKIINSMAFATLGALILSNAIVNATTLRSFRKEGGRFFWSDAVYSLADYVKQNQDQTYLLMDWGFNNQLLLLSDGAIKKRDMFSTLAATRPEEEQIDFLYRWTWNPSSLFVFHTPEHSVGQQPRVLFEKMLAKYGLRSDVSKLFFQRDGQIVYSLEKVSKLPDSTESGGSRYIFFREAELFDDKAGGAKDAKPAASEGYALGMYWGKNLSDYAAYSFKLDKDVDAIMLEMRVAFPGTRPQAYHVFVDGSLVQTAMLKPTGGFGSLNSEWQLVSVLLGGISKGAHQIMLRPARSNSVINIDFLALREL